MGTPALSFIGATGGGADRLARRGGLIVPVLVAPLTVPVLIFGVSACNSALGGTVLFLDALPHPLRAVAGGGRGGTIAAAAALRQAE